MKRLRIVSEGNAKIFKNIGLLPIWNYFQIAHTKDLRYMLVLENYNDMPTPKIVGKRISFNPFELVITYDFTPDELKGYWKDIHKQFSEDTLNNSTKRLEFEMWDAYFDWVTTGRDRVYNARFARYRADLDTNYTRWILSSDNVIELFKKYKQNSGIEGVVASMDKEFETLEAFFNSVKNNTTFEGYMNVRPWCIEQMNCKEVRQTSWVDEVTDIEYILKKPIDIYRTSVEQYMSYRKRAKEISQQLERGTWEK
jgi:hypothetical protein